jgi:[ribosomal protein S5]-alanine N-acetyltransferase
MKRIETANLILLSCDPEILRSAIEGDEHLGKQLGIIVLNNWTEFGTAALAYSLDKLDAADNQAGWWTWFPIHRQDNTLIGSGGYKGKPVDGIVEIGYEIAPAYRNKGLATELANALLANAFTFEDVHTVVAHTLGEENASTGVLKKCGFKKRGEINDPDDGLIWKWELKRAGV